MDYLFKTLIIGDSGAGKSALLVRFADNAFYTEYISTVGVDYRIKTLKVEHNSKQYMVKLQCWDTAGQEKFDNIVQSYYRGAQGVLLVFDTTSRASFDNVQKWLDKAATNAGADIVKLLVGTKIDLPNREVQQGEAEKFAIEKNVPYVETSAKDGSNVQDAFLKLCRNMLDKVESSGAPKPGTAVPSINPSAFKSNKPEKKGCC